jgi:type III secretion protein D
MNQQQRGPGTLFRLLSGLNADAGMELAPGDWILGSGDDSDLILSDAGIEPRHALLRVDAGGGLTLVPLDGPVTLDGRPLSDAGAAVPPLTVFSLGGVLAAHGPCDSPWPELETSFSPPLREENGGEEAAPGSGDGAEKAAPPASLPEPHSEPYSEKGAPLPANAPLPVPEAEKKAPPPFGKKRLIRAARVLLLLVLFGGVLIGYPAFENSGKRAERLERDLRTHGFAGLTVAGDGAKGIRISGTVATNARLDDLTRYVAGLDLRPELAVVSLEDVVAALRAGAGRADAAVGFFRSDALLRIRGYARDRQALDTLVRQSGGIPQGVAVRVDVVFWERAEAELRALLAAAGLQARARFLPDAYRVILRAPSLSAQDRQRLRPLLSACEDFFGVPDVVRIALAEDEPRPEAPVSRPSAVPEPEETSVTCRDLRLGRRGEDLEVLFRGFGYGTGAKLPGGMQVKLVSPSHVVLQRDGHALVCADVEPVKE